MVIRLLVRLVLSQDLLAEENRHGRVLFGQIELCPPEPEPALAGAALPGTVVVGLPQTALHRTDRDAEPGRRLADRTLQVRQFLQFVDRNGDTTALAPAPASRTAAVAAPRRL